MSNNFYPAIALTGGTDGCLDYIDGDVLMEGDVGFAMIIGVGCLKYILNASSSEVSNSPLTFPPATNPGTKRWELQGVASTGFDGMIPSVSPTVIANFARLYAGNRNGVDGTACMMEITEDGIVSPLALQNDLDEVVTSRNPGQAVHLTAATSGSNGITIADNAQFAFGTKSFSIVQRLSLDVWTTGAAQILNRKVSGSAGAYYGWEFGISATGYPYLILYRNSAGTTFTATVKPTLTDNAVHKIMVSVTREIALAAGSIIFSVDGKQLGAAVAITLGAPTTVSNTGDLYIMGDSAVRTAGTTYSVYLFNKAVTSTSILDLYRNGVRFKYRWGSQTALTSGTLVIGREYVIDAYNADDDFTNIGGTNASGTIFVATGTTPTHWAHSSSLRPVGAIVALESEGILNDYWYDTSTNALNASYPAAGVSYSRKLGAVPMTSVVSDTTPQLGGDLDLNQKSLTYPLPTSNLTGEGDKFTGTLGESVTFGQTVYYKFSDGKYWLSDADAGSTMTIVAIAMESGSANDSKTLLRRGWVRNDSWSWTGGPLYGSGTAGAMSQTINALTTGGIVQVVAPIVSAHVIWFEPSPEWTEVL